MRTNTKVKVKVADLLAAVEKKRSEIISKHEKEKSTYDDRLNKYRQEVVKQLRDKATKIEKGADISLDYSGRITISSKISKPTEPVLNLSKIDRTIATLRIAADDAIAISADDYAEYLG